MSVLRKYRVKIEGGQVARPLRNFPYGSFLLFACFIARREEEKKVAEFGTRRVIEIQCL